MGLFDPCSPILPLVTEYIRYNFTVAKGNTNVGCCLPLDVGTVEITEIDKVDLSFYIRQKRQLQANFPEGHGGIDRNILFTYKE